MDNKINIFKIKKALTKQKVLSFFWAFKYIFIPYLRHTYDLQYTRWIVYGLFWSCGVSKSGLGIFFGPKIEIKVARHHKRCFFLRILPIHRIKFPGQLVLSFLVPNDNFSSSYV